MANKNLFLWRHLEGSSVYLINKVYHIGMERPFCGFPMIDCYQNHGLLSPTHVLITHSHSCIHGVWTTLFGCYNVFWITYQKFQNKQSCYWMLQMQLCTRQFLRKCAVYYPTNLWRNWYYPQTSEKHFFFLHKALREKCLYSDFFWSVFSRIRTD